MAISASWGVRIDFLERKIFRRNDVVMSREQKRGKQDKGSDDVQKVIVAVKASKEIPKTALVWALTHVVQIGDCITLLVVVPSQSSGTFLLFPHFDLCEY